MAKLLNEEVDVTIVPARTALKFVQFSKKHKNLSLDKVNEDELDDTMLDEIMDIIGSITSRSNKKITKDWLYDNIPLTEMVRFMSFIFEGMGSGTDSGDPVEAEAAAKN